MGFQQLPRAGGREGGSVSCEVRQEEEVERRDLGLGREEARRLQEGEGRGDDRKEKERSGLR